MRHILAASLAALGLFAGPIVLPDPFAGIAHAQTANAPAEIRFPGGYFRETGDRRWTEFDRRGTPRYDFTARETGNTTILTNTSLGVTLWLDRDARAVFAEWPGQPRHRLHTITGIDEMAFPPPRPSPEPEPKPEPKPPAPPEPPAKPSAPATPATLQVVRASGDYVFRRDQFDPLGWSESKPDGDRERLRQVGTEETRLYLLGAGDRLVVIDLAGEAVLSASGEALERRHSILDAATVRDAMVSPNPPSIPAPPTEPGTLSEAERRACELRGGTVERAGLLGAERCTNDYVDGGMVCTDSDQCSGQCIAAGDPGIGDRAVGTCQMTDNPFGCYARVEDGLATPMLCVD